MPVTYKTSHREHGLKLLLQEAYKFFMYIYCVSFLILPLKYANPITAYSLDILQLEVNKLCDLLKQEIAQTGFTEVLNFALVRNTH